jgi:hypothetical protein
MQNEERSSIDCIQNDVVMTMMMKEKQKQEISYLFHSDQQTTGSSSSTTIKFAGNKKQCYNIRSIS